MRCIAWPWRNRSTGSDSNGIPAARAAAGTGDQHGELNVTNQELSAAWNAWCDKTAAELAQDEAAATLGGLATTNERLFDSLHDLATAVERWQEAGAAEDVDNDASVATGATAVLAVLHASRVLLEVFGEEQQRRAAEGGAA